MSEPGSLCNFQHIISTQCKKTQVCTHYITSIVSEAHHSSQLKNTKCGLVSHLLDTAEDQDQYHAAYEWHKVVDTLQYKETWAVEVTIWQIWQNQGFLWKSTKKYFSFTKPPWWCHYYKLKYVLILYNEVICLINKTLSYTRLYPALALHPVFLKKRSINQKWHTFQK
jgi:hypothetical protein